MKRRLKKSHIFILIVMLICPVVGPLFFLYCKSIKTFQHLFSDEIQYCPYTNQSEIH